MRVTTLKKLIDFPEERQAFNYDCGAKCIQLVLMYYGFDMPEIEIIKIAKTDKSGTSFLGLKKVAKKFKLKVKSKKMSLDDLKKYIDKKIPVIIAIQAWPKRPCHLNKSWKHGHYVIPLGYDEKRFYFEDPAAVLRTYLTFNELNERWHDMGHDKKKVQNLGIIIYGTNPVFRNDKVIHMGNDAYKKVHGFLKIKKYKRIK